MVQFLSDTSAHPETCQYLLCLLFSENSKSQNGKMILPDTIIGMDRFCKLFSFLHISKQYYSLFHNVNIILFLY